MDQELWNFCMDTFCGHAQAIRGDVELNGGLWDSQQLDDLKDCVSGVKDLLRIKAMAPSVAAK